MRYFDINPFAILIGTGLLASLASGDILELESGGSLRGTLQNPDQQPRTTYVVKTETGSVVTLAAEPSAARDSTDTVAGGV